MESKTLVESKVVVVPEFVVAPEEVEPPKPKFKPGDKVVKAWMAEAEKLAFPIEEHIGFVKEMAVRTIGKGFIYYVQFPLCQGAFYEEELVLFYESMRR